MTATRDEVHSHEQETGHSHDRDHGPPDVPIELNPIWQQDNVMLHSVGVDIGSSGTQVAFSKLHLRRMGQDLTSRYVVVERRTLFESEVQLTPYTDDLRIDAGVLGTMLDQAYADARLAPEDIDTGVVILTGEALRRLNAERIAAVVAERAGDLVCATAGHHMEAMLAAYGSGAVLESHTHGSRILNVDIGGGTTKLSLVDSGQVLSTAALHVGGRLMVVDGGVLTRLEPAGRDHAAAAGFILELGDPVEDSVLDGVADSMAATILEVIGDGVVSPRVRAHHLTDPIDGFGDLDAVIFSGGVAEYVYGLEERDFGDLGRRLGAGIRARIDAGALPTPVLEATERIRATVLGASEYTVQLSGITSHVGSAATALPRRNVQVVRPVYELGDRVDPETVAAAIARHVTNFDLADFDGDIAVALSWSGEPAYSRLRGLAEGVAAGLAERIAAGRTIYLMLDADIARTLGHLLHDELGVANDLIILDGVLLRDFDFVDLGRLRQPSNTVPVTIKSLIFGAGHSGPPQEENGSGLDWSDN